MARVVLSHAAEADVREIWAFIAVDNATAADGMIDRFTTTLDLLVGNPDIGTKQDQYRKGLRRHNVERFAVFYSKTRDGILVYRVLHAARDVEGLLCGQ